MLFEANDNGGQAGQKVAQMSSSCPLQFIKYPVSLRGTPYWLQCTKVHQLNYFSPLYGRKLEPTPIEDKFMAEFLDGNSRYEPKHEITFEYTVGVEGTVHTISLERCVEYLEQHFGEFPLGAKGSGFLYMGVPHYNNKLIVKSPANKLQPAAKAEVVDRRGPYARVKNYLTNVDYWLSRSVGADPAEPDSERVNYFTKVPRKEFVDPGYDLMVFITMFAVANQTWDDQNGQKGLILQP